MKLLAIVIVALIAAVALSAGVVALIGTRLPKTHSASRSILLHQPRSDVYSLIRDFASAPAWRTDVRRVELTTRADGGLGFREEGGQGTINYELAEDVPLE